MHAIREKLQDAVNSGLERCRHHPLTAVNDFRGQETSKVLQSARKRTVENLITEQTPYRLELMIVDGIPNSSLFLCVG